MSYRYTNTDKWNDAWFSSLKQIEMLLFMYLCDNCDIAGFIEVNYKRWAVDLGSSVDTIQGAKEGLGRGLIVSKDGDCLFIKNFLKHQKNYPLNKNNNAHLGIIKRFQYYSQKFDIQDIDIFISAPREGLVSPYGNGSGKECIDNSNIPEEKNWRNDFTIYLKGCNEVYKKLIDDKEFLKEQQYFNPGVNIYKTILKGYKGYWGTEEGWENKKSKKTKDINWKATIVKSIGMNGNKVYYTKQELAEL